MRSMRVPGYLAAHPIVVSLAFVVLVATVALLAVGPRRLLAAGGFAPADSRLVTGILVTGTADRPILYVTSSDPRIGGGPEARLLPLDTNSGVLSQLVREGDGAWQRTDLVRGLPRSGENHATNGMALDRQADVLYVAQGAMTNAGAPSARLGDVPEYALAGALLAIDLRRIGDRTYDLPTLDDENRSGVDDAADPFGGDKGRNQARLSRGGPVELFATGLRNPYDVVKTSTGRIYTIDNGAGWYWGGRPAHEGAEGRCTNAVRDVGTYDPDSLHLVVRGYYGGHPNPTRGNQRNTFNESKPQSPVARAEARECDYFSPSRNPRVLTTFPTSTNGLVEYRAQSFGGALRGNLLAASIDQRVYRIVLDRTGSHVVRSSPLFKIAGFPVDVTAQGDADVFPGTIWVADYAAGRVIVFEPKGLPTGPHWQSLPPSQIRRQEVSFVPLDGRLYLAGGARQQEVYDPQKGTWRFVAPLPRKLDHIQGVVADGRIYYIGGLAAFPRPEVGTVYVYDPQSNRFTRGTPMPRGRGAGGAATYRGKIYYAGGLHDGKAVPWFDVYDPKLRTWRRLPDMPRARDHFQAAVVGQKLYAIGGRDTEVGKTISETDVFDFATGRWSTGGAPIPTPRGGYAVAVRGREIITIGGEGVNRVYSNVEAYNVDRNTWRTLQPLPTPRHGIQAAVCGGQIFVAAGGAAAYGTSPSTTNEVYLTGRPHGCGPRAKAASMRTATAIRFRSQTVVRGLASPTSLQFGPDGRLYVSEQNGEIHSLAIARRANGRYVVEGDEAIDSIRKIPNHDDDGSSATQWRDLFNETLRRIGVRGDERRVPERAETMDGGVSKVQLGARMFYDAGCAGCHTFAPAGSHALSGPPLDHVRQLPAAYLRRAIVRPNAELVPGYGPDRMPQDYVETLTRNELAGIVAFLRSRP